MGDFDNIRKDFEEPKQDALNSFDDIRKDFEQTQSAAEAAAERTRKSIKRQSVISPELREGLTNLGKGFGHGVGNVGLSALYGINQLAGTEEEKRKYDEYLQNRAKEYEQQGSAYKVGNVAGEIAGTGPLVEASGAIKAIQAAKLLPIASTVTKGGVVGGMFGAATSAGNPNQSVGENVLENAKVGAVAGPLVDLTIGGAKSLVNKAKLELATRHAASRGGLGSGGVKATLETLQKIGLTPQQAQAEVARLGPKATLADIDPALLTEAGGLASFGDEATSIMKNRFGARADTSNYEATHIMNRNLGGNPDLDVLRERIKKDAQRAVAGDYKIAHAQAGLDIQPVIDDIDKKLENAVGPKANALREIKSYFYKNAVDAQGNPIKVLKHDVEGLHEIRTQLDARINDKNPTTTYDKNALNAVKDIRAGVDQQLKTIPEMKRADEKFAQRMDVLKGIDIGQNIFDRKINYAQFAKEFNGASAEKQDIIREGIKGKIYNAMDQATRGELSEAQKLLGKASANRAKIKLAFGSNADEVLDALEKEATFRASEKDILHQSHTAEKQAIQRKYGARNDGPGLVSDVAGGIVTDMLHGTTGLATGVRTVRHLGGSVINRLYNTDKTAVGAADIFSRSGAQLNNALSTLDRVHSVRSRIQSTSSRPSKNRLPTAPTAIGEYTTNQESQQ